MRRGNEKGRVENGVGYIKKNFLNGLEISDLTALNHAARQWLNQVANVRLHGETRQRPLDRFKDEQAKLLPFPEQPFDNACCFSDYFTSNFLRYSAADPTWVPTLNTPVNLLNPFSFLRVFLRIKEIGQSVFDVVTIIQVRLC